MAVQRCPECGRVVAGDATDCLACGHQWSGRSALSPPGPPPQAVTQAPGAPGTSSPGFSTASIPPTGGPRPGNPFGGASVPPSGASVPPPGGARSPGNPFGTPSLAPHVAGNPFAGGAPKPVTGIYEAGGPPPATAAAPDPIRPPSQEMKVQPPPSSPASPIAQPEPPEPEPTPPPAPAPAMPPPPPRNEVERFLRSPLAFPAIGAAVFLSTLILGLVIAFSGRDEVLDQIDSGVEGAREVARRLDATPERTPREDLLLGHAEALLGRPERALKRYRVAARRGAVDERALDYVMLALDNPVESADLPREVLAAWPGEEVDERLRELTRADAWHKRHNALGALGKRGKGTPEVRLRVAFIDLKDEALTTCDEVNRALDVIRDYGKGDEALDAIADFRKTPRLRCATDRLQQVEADIKRRG